MQSIVIYLPLSIFATLTTYQLRHKYHWNVIRASTVPTLLFSVIFYYFHLPYAILALFFGSTFVGMSSEDKLGKLEIIFSSIIYVLIYSLLIKFLKGPGGVLGTIAFISCSTTVIIKKYILNSNA